MERRKFFKLLGGTVAAAVVAPRVLAEETPKIVDKEVEWDEFPIYNEKDRKEFWISWSKGKYKEWHTKYGKDFNLTDFIKISNGTN